MNEIIGRLDNIIELLANLCDNNRIVWRKPQSMVKIPKESKRREESENRVFTFIKLAGCNGIPRRILTRRTQWMTGDTRSEIITSLIERGFVSENRIGHKVSYVACKIPPDSVKSEV